MAAVDVVPGIDPLPRLLVQAESWVKLPRDSCPVQVQELAAVNTHAGNGRQALVQAQQHREVRERQQHRPDAGQAGQRDVLAQEVLVKALPAGEVLERRGG